MHIFIIANDVNATTESDKQSHNNCTSSPNWAIFSQNPFHYKT